MARPTIKQQEAKSKELEYEYKINSKYTKILDLDLTPTEKLIMLYLHKTADENGISSITQRELADNIMASLSTVKRTLSRLYTVDLISRQFRYAKGQGEIANDYWINF